jgi:hypothetical protein
MIRTSKERTSLFEILEQHYLGRHAETREEMDRISVITEVIIEAHNDNDPVDVLIEGFELSLNKALEDKNFYEYTLLKFESDED